jgi:hypothetical protein
MKALGIFIAVIVGLYVAYKLIYPTYTYRYRMTVEIDVHGETKTGTSVIEVRLSKQPRFLPEVPPVATTVIGEAVFVDLGEGRNILALLASGPYGRTVDNPQFVVPRHFMLSYSDRDIAKFPQLQGRWNLESRLPTLVTFTDLNDPKAVRVVQPEEFEQVFGPGVRFKRVWVEMTSDPVTRGIESKMPMLTTHRDWMRRMYSVPTTFTPRYHLFTRG